MVYPSIYETFILRTPHIPNADIATPRFNHSSPHLSYNTLCLRALAALALQRSATGDRLLQPMPLRSWLQQLLKYHVHSGNVYSSQLRNGMKVSTLEGRKLTVELEDGHVEIIGGKHSDEATVTKANIRASNGVVHVIDKVLIPADWHAPEH